MIKYFKRLFYLFKAKRIVKQCLVTKDAKPLLTQKFISKNYYTRLTIMILQKEKIESIMRVVKESLVIM